MNDREKMIEELIQKPLRADDKFNFRCDQCGNCCKNRVDILLSPFDLCRMAQALENSIPDVLVKYVDIYIGDTSKVPLVSLKMREDNGKCPFLDENNRCGIHANKPVVCALFPLGRCASRGEENTDIFYILQPTDCGDKTESHTPREWLGKFDLEESEQWFSIWQDIVMEISEHTKVLFPKMPGISGIGLQSYIAQILYTNYDLDKPIIPQVKENGKLAIKMISMIEEEFGASLNDVPKDTCCISN